MQPVTFPDMHESMAPCMGFGQIQGGEWKLTAGTDDRPVPVRDAGRRHRLTDLGTAPAIESPAAARSEARRNEGEQRVSYIYPGIVIGALYALLGGSLTLTYSLTGVINLAVGAMAYASAYLFYHLVMVDGWPLWLAGITCVAAATVLGFVLWFLIFRNLEKKNLVVQLTATIGLAVAIPAADAAAAADRDRLPDARASCPTASRLLVGVPQHHARPTRGGRRGGGCASSPWSCSSRSRTSACRRGPSSTARRSPRASASTRPASAR